MTTFHHIYRNRFQGRSLMVSQWFPGITGGGGLPRCESLLNLTPNTLLGINLPKSDLNQCVFLDPPERDSLTRLFNFRCFVDRSHLKILRIRKLFEFRYKFMQIFMTFFYSPIVNSRESILLRTISMENHNSAQGYSGELLLEFVEDNSAYLFWPRVPTLVIVHCG
jgi:hypothetical protein